jgi:hypothetical protein
VLVPFYAICERLNRTHESALRLGLGSLKQMTAALLWAVENPAKEYRVLSVQEIRALARTV